MIALEGGVDGFFQVAIADKRVSKFLQSDELATDNVQILPPNDRLGVSIKGGTFAWTAKDGTCLKDINLSIKEGHLVAVVGQVGAGKSSLCAAIVGLMERKAGEVLVKVRVHLIVMVCLINFFNILCHSNLGCLNVFKRAKLRPQPCNNYIAGKGSLRSAAGLDTKFNGAREHSLWQADGPGTLSSSARGMCFAAGFRQLAGR